MRLKVKKSYDNKGWLVENSETFMIYGYYSSEANAKMARKYL